ncbi:MAG: hypothetical protein KME26_06155 [Oscillatoria princeps RMCB-10]|jgi:hypothetical protein|nr:hypothetical protein [Oscillatoria princeps RMCB-10]
MEIKTDDYRVWYDPATATLNFQGLLREGSIADYKPIEQLLDEALAQEVPALTINLKGLEFIDSSATSVLSRFVIVVRKKKTIQLAAKGSKGIPWQEKLLDNWHRLMPGLTREWE